MYLHLTVSDIFRFWSKVDKSNPNGCWIWTEGKAKFGYGMFRHTTFFHQHATHPAHRVAWIIFHGQLSPGECVLHNCPEGDNPSCLNPAHMFIGTKGDNNRDTALKGRLVVHRGEDSPASRLTEDDVREIRFQYEKGGVTQRVLAARYGVSQGTISRTITGQCWDHI
jgi:hypothetical protein